MKYIWMKALQNWNWGPVTDPRLLFMPLPFPLSVSTPPLLFSFSFFVPFPPSLFSFFPPCLLSPFYFLVHFVKKLTKPNQIPKSIPKTCYSSNSRNRLVMIQAGLLQHKYLFNSTVFWLKKASYKPEHQNDDLTDNFHSWNFITLKY